MRLATVATALSALNGLNQAAGVLDELEKLQTIAKEAEDNIANIEDILTALETHSSESMARLQDFRATYGPRVAVRTASDVFYGNLFQSTPLTSAGMQTKSAFIGHDDTLWVVDTGNTVFTKDTTRQDAPWVKIAEDYKYVFPWGQGFFGLTPGKSAAPGGGKSNLVYVPNKANPSQRTILSRTFRSIMYDGVRLCGLDGDSKCHCNRFNTQTLTLGRPKWKNHGSAEACFPMGSGEGYSFLQDEYFFVRDLEGKGTRRIMKPTNFQSISGTGNMFVGVGKGGSLFYTEKEEGSLKFRDRQKVSKSVWSGNEAAIEVTVFPIPFEQDTEPQPPMTTLLVGQSPTMAITEEPTIFV